MSSAAPLWVAVPRADLSLCVCFFLLDPVFLNPAPCASVYDYLKDLVGLARYQRNCLGWFCSEKFWHCLIVLVPRL